MYNNNRRGSKRVRGAANEKQKKTEKTRRILKTIIAAIRMYLYLCGASVHMMQVDRSLLADCDQQHTYHTHTKIKAEYCLRRAACNHMGYTLCVHRIV